ncbi:MAG: CHAD domain-containing protein [Phototrophicales bacterium]|nr:CHAD domain-containing protein [Phototrophicales bacterium]
MTDENMTDISDELPLPESELVVEQPEISLIDHLTEQVQPVQDEDTMAEAGRKILLQDFVKMLSKDEGVRVGEDIEFVHDMRVATRRMRSAFRIFEDYYKSKPVRPFIAQLRELAQTLGAVRDLDVLVDDFSRYQGQLVEQEAQEALVHVVEKLEAKRQKARRKLVAYLDSKSYRRFIKTYSAFLTSPGKSAKGNDEPTPTPYQVRHVLPVMVYDHLATVRAYDTVLEDAEVNTLHALRIEFKRLRYSIEFFAPVLGLSIEKFVEEMKQIQNYLGRLNDVVVAQIRLKNLEENGDLGDVVHESFEHYIQSLADEQVTLMAGFGDIWTKFNSRTVQRHLSDALLVLR